jgi:hypothetical protein
LEEVCFRFRIEEFGFFVEVNRNRSYRKKLIISRAGRPAKTTGLPFMSFVLLFLRVLNCQGTNKAVRANKEFSGSAKQ